MVEQIVCPGGRSVASIVRLEDRPHLVVCRLRNRIVLVVVAAQPMVAEKRLRGMLHGRVIQMLRFEPCGFDQKTGR